MLRDLRPALYLPCTTSVQSLPSSSLVLSMIISEDAWVCSLALLWLSLVHVFKRLQQTTACSLLVDSFLDLESAFVALVLLVM